MAHRVVAAVAQRAHFGGAHTEDEYVVVADLLADLDIGAVVGADGQRAVERKLHVAGSRGLGSGGRYLLRQVGARHDHFSHRDAIVRDEHQLEPVAHARVGVDDAGDVVDQLDDALGAVVGRRRLAGDDDGARDPVGLRVGQDRLVAGDDMQQVEQLALVFVDAFDLHVEQARRIHLYAGAARDECREPILVGLFDCPEAALESGLMLVGEQALQASQIPAPVAAQRRVDQPGESRIGLGEPTPRRDAVGHVGKAPGPQVCKVGKNSLYQQVGMQSGDAVDLVAADDRQVRHAHPALAVLVNQRQPGQEAVVAGTVARRLFQELLVNAKYDFQVAWQHMLHQPDRPGLQRLGHQRVVGIGEGPLAQAPGLGPVHRLLVAQHPHQFGHADRRMGVVEVNGHLVGQVVEPRVFFEVAP